MSARLPEPAPLVGRAVTLLPATDELRRRLGPVLRRPEVFAGGYGGGAVGLSKIGPTDNDFARFLDAGQEAPFVVALNGGEHDGRLVGYTSLYEVDEPRETVCLGYTAYDPAVWGTAVNAETKLLLLLLAFGNGFGRVELRADAVNARSRAAIEGLGATFEGIRRRDRRRPDGTWRDAAIFSIIADDLPAVRARLEARIARAEVPVRVRG